MAICLQRFVKFRLPGIWTSNLLHTKCAPLGYKNYSVWLFNVISAAFIPANQRGLRSRPLVIVVVTTVCADVSTRAISRLPNRWSYKSQVVEVMLL